MGGSLLICSVVEEKSLSNVYDRRRRQKCYQKLLEDDRWWWWWLTNDQCEVQLVNHIERPWKCRENVKVFCQRQRTRNLRESKKLLTIQPSWIENKTIQWYLTHRELMPLEIFWSALIRWFLWTSRAHHIDNSTKIFASAQNHEKERRTKRTVVDQNQRQPNNNNNKDLSG